MYDIPTTAFLWKFKHVFDLPISLFGEAILFLFFFLQVLERWVKGGGLVYHVVYEMQDTSDVLMTTIERNFHEIQTPLRTSDENTFSDQLHKMRNQNGDLYNLKFLFTMGVRGEGKGVGFTPN